MRHRFTVVGGALLLAVAACGGGGGGSGSSYGAKGDPAKADRTVEIRELDTLRFDPATLSVRKGETVMFRVVNTGAQLHEFVLGDSKTQDAHDQAIRDDPTIQLGGADNELALDPGQTKEITWTFSGTGPVLYGCHLPGHYAAGMKGTVSIE